VKEIYGVDCAICHGETGDGKTDLAKDMGLTLGDWTDPKTLAGKPDQELFDAIRNGKGKMPPEAVGRAKDDEVRSLILYIRGLAKPQPAAAPAPTDTPAPASTPAPADTPAPPTAQTPPASN
jgi:mono/diheme cytochrome c family protein